MSEAQFQTSTTTVPSAYNHGGLMFSRRFSKEGVSPYDELQWEKRTASITDTKGNSIFEQKDVEVPVDWSMTATNIVASKYLHGQMGRRSGRPGCGSWWARGGDDSRLGYGRRLLRHARRCGHLPRRAGAHAADAEGGLQLAGMVQRGLRPAGAGFRRPELALGPGDRRREVFRHRLPQSAVLGLLHQLGRRLAGIHPDPGQDRGHALQVGLGHGNQSVSIRGSKELLSGGGEASGPLSFMRGFDAFAGVIKSGGKTRRAAKMVILNVDHPDILDFIDCKAKEEAKAFTLIKAGYDGSGPDSEAYSSIFFQNANNSVRVSDEFMRAYENDGEFTTYTVKGHEPVKTYKARDIMRKIAEATWLCGDPGMQFDTTINRWHTSKNTARINASNPCSEYMFLDNSACNLASFNLLKYQTPRAASTSRLPALDLRHHHGHGDPG
jgi:ribonucleoside-diphosphate reductase alpha chain